MTNPNQRELWILDQPANPLAKGYNLVLIPFGEETEFANGMISIRNTNPPVVLRFKPHPEDESALVLDEVVDLPEPNATIHKDSKQVITRRS